MHNITDALPQSQIYFHTPSSIARATFLYPICTGHFYCDKNYLVSRSSYDSFLMILAVNGQGILSTPDMAGSEKSFKKGQLVLIDCYEPHMYKSTGDLEFYWVHFDGINARAYYEYLNSQYGHVIDLSKEQATALLSNMKLLLHGLSSNQGLSEILLGKYLTDCLSFPAHMENCFFKSPSQHHNELSSGKAAVSAPKTTSKAAVAYMRRHMSEDISIESIASAISLSPYYFIRLFKKDYGVSPHQYLMSLRLDSACFFLRSTQRTIKDIAFSCGFKSENSFCIAFKKQLGLTPTAYRNQ